MKKLIKYLREWAKDYNAVQKELSDMASFTEEVPTLDFRSVK